MAKNGNLFGDIGAELMKRAQGAQSVAEQTEEKQSANSQENGSISATDNKVVPSKDLQGKQGKQGKQGSQPKKEYNYGTKRTFPIPDELWDDALILMQIQGLKQVVFIQELIRNAVDSHREEITTVKKMRGEL